MKSNRMRVAGGLVAMVVGVTVGASHVAAQNANVAGAWTLEVTTDAGGTTNPTMTIDQNGAALTGHYVSETLGEADITGTVEGSHVTIRFTASLQGQDVPVVYAADVGPDGMMKGTIDVAGGLAAGTFTGRRAGE